MNIERKVFEAEVKSFDDEKLWIDHFISTEKRDRGGDILKADGMEIQGKVVVLHSHGYGPMGSEPIAKNLSLKPGEFKGKPGIVARTQFYDGSHLNPPDNTGRRLYEKTKSGIMPNWSVGWRPLQEEYVTERNGERTRLVSRWELLEYSIVAVPMQADAQTLPPAKGAPPIKVELADAIQFKVFSELEEKRGELVAWRNSVEDAWEEKPYPNEHACRLEDPGKYIRIRRENDALGPGVHAIWGVQGGDKPVELQAIRLSLSKFTAAQARAWLKSHNRTCKVFEPATGKGDEEGPGCESPGEEKGAIPYKKTPLAAEAEKWDAGAEVGAADVSDLKIMCAWFDSGKPELKTSYKLPHHKQAGEHACVWNGVRAAAAAVMGGRGGVQIPAGDLGRVKGHLASHYGDFDKGKAPWEKEMAVTFSKVLERLDLDLTFEEDRKLFDVILGSIFPELDVEPEPEEKREGDPVSMIPQEYIDLVKEVANWQSLLIGRLDSVEAELDALKVAVQPEPAPKPSEKKASAKPPELVFREKGPALEATDDKEAAAQAILNVAKEVVGENVRAAIDKMRGKIR